MNAAHLTVNDVLVINTILVLCHIKSRLIVICCILHPQAAFQTALTEEFMRIRASDPAINANQAAALALTRLRERAPQLLAARG